MHTIVLLMFSVALQKSNEFAQTAKGLISLVYLKIQNHDENILAPKRKDCG